MKLFFTIKVFLILLMMSPMDLYAFGANGHRIVAGVAEQHLTRRVKKSLMKISKGRSLAVLSTWPDEIRSDKSWDHAKAWHYISIDDEENFDNYEHASSGDIITALKKFEKILVERTASDEEIWQALAFFIHFVGDIHQPLHVGRRSDRGGNSIRVKWFDEASNLHSVWDSGLIDFQNLSYSEYIVFINHASRSDVNSWQSSTYLDWAKESKKYRDNVYFFGSQGSLNYPNLGYEYNFINRPIIERRLLQAGVRLAGRLNQLFN